MAALNNPNCAELMAQALELQVKSLNDQIALLRGYVPASQTVAVAESSESVNKPTKKKKKVVDPNRPKRPHSAYQMFIMDVLPKLKVERPDLPQRDIMSLGAKEWSTCPAKKKEALESIANKEKAKYDVVLAAYEANLASSSSSSSSAEAALTTAAPPVVGKKRQRAKSEKKVTVPVPIAAAPVVPVSVPVVAASVPVSVPGVQEEKKRKKEKKSKKEGSNPGEESVKKKKVK